MEEQDKRRPWQPLIGRRVPSDAILDQAEITCSSFKHFHHDPSPDYHRLPWLGGH